MDRYKDKVLLFAPLNQVGGIAVWTRNLLEYIQANHMDYIVYVDASLCVKNDANRNSIARVYRGITQTIRLLLKLKKALEVNTPQKVWRSCSGSWGFYREVVYNWLCKKYGADSIIHFHFGRIPELCNKKNWEYKIMCKVIKDSRACIIIDQPSYEALCKAGFSRKIFLIPNPCAFDVKRVAEKSIMSKKIDSYLFVGHVVKAKGVYELVKAFTAMSENLELCLMGPYEEKDRVYLERIASQKQLGKWLHIIGPKEKEYVLMAMQKATALILPSYTEGFPYVILEAMACGCPILASRVAAIPDMINWNREDTCGICFESQSIEEVIGGVQLFRSRPQQHHIYALNGKKKVLDAYTLENIYPLYESVLKV